MAGAAFPDCDLRVHPPRSARVKIGGLYFLARTIDKVRAEAHGTLGEYKVAPGISAYLFEWLGITQAQFTQAVAAASGDDDVLAWMKSHTDANLYAEINHRLETRSIRDAAHFAEVLPRYPVLNEYPQLRNWFEIFELDDVWIFEHAADDDAVASGSPS